MTAEPPRESAHSSRLIRLVTAVTVISPLLGVALAAALWWSRGLPTACLAACGAMYVVTVGGITIGFHRLFSHYSFATAPWLRRAFGIAGSMAGQGPLLFWVAAHRRHHRHSDHEGDPHSPHTHGAGAAAVLAGWWHAHLGWMLQHEPDNYHRFARDLRRDRDALFVHRHYLAWVLLGLLLPGAAVGLVEHSWSAIGLGVLWGGLVRMFLVHHVTWSVNSVCHLFGSAPHDTGDESRNNFLIALFTLGEGWHNNHHAFPSSARHGLRWWQFDASYLVLLSLRALGLAWDLRKPGAARETAGDASVTLRSFEDQPTIKTMLRS